ncbi:MAG: hypothetical protein AAFQ82_03190 [Myxococcota bacterium]
MRLNIVSRGEKAIEAARAATGGVHPLVNKDKAAIIKVTGGYRLVEISPSPNPASDGIAVPKSPDFAALALGPAGNAGVAEALGWGAGLIFGAMRLV